MKLIVALLLSIIAVTLAVPNCTTYCSLITTNCAGNYAQYDNMNHCMAMCGAFPVGTDADMGGNTLGCRIYHANASSTLGLDHCYHAGPNGADLASNASICGTQCEAYCSIMLHKPGCNDTLRAFNAMAECTAICSSFPSSMTLYYNNASGNTLQCRLYHAKVAFSNGATSLAAHCAHAAPLGGGVCGDAVDNYCNILDVSCKGVYQQYTTVSYCKTFAKFLPNNTFDDHDGDTIACRAYHAVVGGSGSGAAFHCYHGGMAGNGTGTCGTTMCDSFCALSAKICPNNYGSNNTGCLADCNAASTRSLGTGPTDATTDSFYCRLYHLGAAAGDPTTHCAHALADSATCKPGSTPTPTPNTPTPGPNTPAPPGPTPAPGSGAILGFSVLLAFVANLL
jgi:hypothetical protein